MKENDLQLSSEELWQKGISLLREVMTTDEERSQMERYFPLFISHSIEGNEYVVGLAEQFQVDWLSPKLMIPLERALHSAGLPEEIHVRFAVKENPNNSVISTPSPELARVRTSEAQRIDSHQLRGMPSTMPLHENYTFENFVRGPSNSFAHAAAIAVAKGPGRTSYNPLFIYGGTGLGKTHLMEAIGHYVLDHSQSTSVCFITSETFLNEYVNAIQNNSLPAFREQYRKVDVLLMDDVQFIAGKEKVQEEFFWMFNSLILYHKQIVLTSDVSPKNLNRFEERLIGRFQQGMVVEIESPSYETRLAILKFKAQATQKIIPEEILKFIAENIRSHVRAIEGALSRIVTFMSMQNDIPLSIDIAKNLLRDLIEEEKTIKDLSISDIMKTVANFYGVTIDDILSTQRTQTLVTPRQLAMFLSRKLTTRSLQEIADEFNKTHATVLHGAQTIQKRLDVEPDLKKSMEDIVSQMGRKASDILE